MTLDQQSVTAARCKQT